jgi:foldase protein PrsA
VNDTTKALVGLGAALAIGLAAAGGTYLSAMNAQAGAYVATVNGEKIPLARFDQAMIGVSKQMRLDIDEKTPEGKKNRLMVQKNVIDQLCELQILMNEAKKRKLTATDKEVAFKFNDIQRQFPNPAKFEQTLKQYNLTIADLRSQISQGVTIEKLQAEKGKDLKLSEKEVRDYYDKNPKLFQRGDEVSASHILVKEEKLAKDILARLKKGESFAKLAEQYSIDPGSKKKGGDLGPFGHGMMVPEFEKVAFSLQKGQLSDLVKTNFGYHILLGGVHSPAHVQSFDEAKTRLSESLLKQRQGEEFQKWLTGLKKTTKVDIRPEYAVSPPPSAENMMMRPRNPNPGKAQQQDETVNPEKTEKPSTKK